jgi:hypothetical protein
MIKVGGESGRVLGVHEMGHEDHLSSGRCICYEKIRDVNGLKLLAASCRSLVQILIEIQDRA